MKNLSIIKRITAVTTMATFLTLGYSGIIAPSFAEAAPRPIRHEHRVHKAHKQPRAFKPMPAKHGHVKKHHIVHHHRPMPPRHHKHHHRHKNRDAIAAALVGIAIGSAIANNAD